MNALRFSGLSAVLLMLALAPEPARAEMSGVYEVTGVGDGDMLKMRAGPGTGFDILLGLPNGTELRVHECEQTGGTRWCEVSLRQARSVRGYVSWAYIREK